MEYLIGGGVGLALGVVIGLLKDLLCWSGGGTRSFTNRAYTYMALGMALNVGALLCIYLLREKLPWPFEGPLIGTALGLALTGQLLSLRKARQAEAGERQARAEQPSSLPTETEGKQE